MQHEDAGASELLEQTLALLREPGTDELAGQDRVQHLLDVALTCNFLGQIRLRQGDHEGAAQLFSDGLSQARSAPDRLTILVSLYDLALSSQAQGDLTSAAQHLQEGLSLSAEAGDEPSAAYYLEALAAVARLQDHPERVVHLLAAAGALLQARGSGWLHAYVPRFAGRCCGGVAVPHGRCGIRAGLGVGRVPRRQAGRAVRTTGSTTRPHPARRPAGGQRNRRQLSPGTRSASATTTAGGRVGIGSPKRVAAGPGPSRCGRSVPASALRPEQRKPPAFGDPAFCRTST